MTETDPDSADPKERILVAVKRLDEWLARNGFEGYDPGDLQGQLVLIVGDRRENLAFRILSKGTYLLASRAPLLARRLLLIPRRRYAMAMGFFLHAYSDIFLATGDHEYLDRAQLCARWLLDNSTSRCGLGWGLPYPWKTRILIPAHTLCGTNGAICGEGLLRLFDILGNEEYIRACVAVCETFINELKYDRIGKNVICFHYTPIDNFHVHNANLSVAALLARVGKLAQKDQYLELADQAANYALNEQREDGSLSYWGSDQAAGFQSDSYHSGFEIRALFSLHRVFQSKRLAEAARRYYRYFEASFTGPSGETWRNPRDGSLVDIAGCAEAIICNAQLASDFPEAQEQLHKCARWTIANMMAPSGYFIYRIERRKGRTVRVEVPFIRWGQAWMLRALAAYLSTVAAVNIRVQAPASALTALPS